jgi:hypothetical protein
MANRLLPFRQYNEHDVVNLFSLDTSSLTLSNMTHAANGAWDAGVIVKVSNGDMTQEPVAVTSADGGLQTYLGETDYPHVGGNYYPEVPLKVDVADGATDVPFGITLRQTIAFDENGEKLLYYKQKLLELQGVLPGEAVPVLTKGIVTVAASAVSGTPTPGSKVYLGTGGNVGKITTNTSNVEIGTCLAAGDRDNAEGLSSSDYFADDGKSSKGAYYVIKIDL